MNIEIKEKEFLEKEIIIILSPEEIETEKNKKICELLNSVTLKGFRKGHVTKDVLINKFDAKITNDSFKELINKIFIETINKNNFKIISLPTFQVSKINNVTTVTINFETLPEIKLNINNITIPEYKSEITEFDVSEEIHKLKIINGKWQETDLPIMIGDILTIDLFELEMEKEILLLNNNDIFLYENFIFFDGLIDSLNGLKKDSTIILNLNNKKIFDKILLNKIDIKLHIKKIMRSENLPNDIELKAKLNINENDDLYSNIKFDLEKKSSIISKRLLKTSIIEALLENNKFEIPKSLIKDSLSDYEKRKIQISKTDLEKKIKLELLLNEIKIKFNITASKEEIQKILETFYKKAKNTTDDIYKKIENNILEEKVLNLILNKVKKDIVKITYQKLKTLEFENVYKY